MEQFDEIETLFKQLQDAGNPRIPESHLNDLNKRLDAFVSPISGHANTMTLRKAIAISAITVVTASLIYFVYNKFSESESKSLLKDNIKTETSDYKVVPDSTSTKNVSKNSSLKIHTIEEDKKTNLDLVPDNNLKENKEQFNTVPDNNKKAESKHSNTVSNSDARAVSKNNSTLFKLISDPNTINQTISENEEIAEIKYSVSYNLVSPTIYINLPKGLKFSYTNNILVVRGTPTNVLGKQSVSIKALANDVVDSVNFIITVVQKP